MSQLPPVTDYHSEPEGGKRCPLQEHCSLFCTASATGCWGCRALSTPQLPLLPAPRLWAAPALPPAPVSPLQQGYPGGKLPGSPKPWNAPSRLASCDPCGVEGAPPAPPPSLAPLHGPGEARTRWATQSHLCSCARLCMPTVRFKGFTGTALMCVLTIFFILSLSNPPAQVHLRKAHFV